ncbi:MAG: NAD(P)H-dependent oxidoreductase [Sphingomonas sp.]|jgi:putative NADPH-quinone reductase|uniref:NAD(P)H-dependent oxidoreductase n=1 Tax=Sphingomonas sp. TaxID=28214 RepID=UPI0035641C26
MTRIALIDGHPDPDRARFVHALADSYRAGAVDGGHEVRSVELATLDFPLLRSRAAWEQDPPPPAIVAAQETLAWADHSVILYPLWLGDMPALLKAFLEQTLRPGFAIDPKGAGLNSGLLRGKSARLVVTMGMPAIFYRFYFGAHSVKSFERNILKLVGMKPVRHTLVGGVEGSPEGREKALDELFELGQDGA